MKRNYKILLIAGSIIIIAIIMFFPLIIEAYGFYFCDGKDAIKTVQKELKLKLPKEAEVIKYDYENKTAYFSAKIKIPKEAAAEIKSVFSEQLWRKVDGYKTVSEKMAWDFTYQENIEWWDLKPKQVVSGYFSSVSIKSTNFRRGTRTAYVWVFIAEAGDGGYYLYLDRGADNSLMSEKIFGE